MSKYYKAEDVIREIEEMENCYNGWSDTYDKAQIIGVLEELPTIEVSEDCISREWVKGICEAMLDEEMLGHMLGYIEDAPSVIPKPKEGEWMTNADCIRSMSDEQLYEFLSEWECGDIDYSITFCDLCKQGGNELNLDCDGCRKHWLQRDAVDVGGLMYWKRNTTFTADTPQTERSE